MTADRAMLAALQKVQGQMETVLDDVLPRAHGPQAIVTEAMRYAALGGGKRLRPFLLIQCANMFGVPDRVAMRAAAALECIHVYSLIHDDLPCMDDDALRRGQPTVHRAYDEAIAVLAGDGLQALAFDILAGLDLPASMRVQLIAALARAAGANGMVGGQAIDMTVQENERDQALISQLQALKTGALIEYAVWAGAYLGGADAAQISALDQYAQKLGLLFQITDDILDETGEPELMGKAVKKDQNQGKITFVTLLGLNGAKDKAQQLAREAQSDVALMGETAKILCAIVDFVLARQS